MSGTSNEKQECPVDHSKFIQKTSCPVPHDSPLNPYNMMPTLSQDPSPSQRIQLPTERTISSIPKGSHENVGKEAWTYPSPQQFYNALKRKGWETPEENVETMVDIHNFLNEACWKEVLDWEKKYHCDCDKISLLKFQGRPSEPTPKARFFGLLGAEKPFDRHDWTVDRCGKAVRYVIDYYGGQDEGPSPVFHVDVRPALDSPGAFWDRARNFLGGIWDGFTK